MMAETGMSFDPVVDEPLEPLELKKGVSKKEKKKKEVEIDPEVLEQQRLIELKKKDIEEYGRTYIWEDYVPADEAHQKIWLDGAEALRHINPQVLEDIEDVLILEGFQGLLTSNTEIDQ